MQLGLGQGPESIEVHAVMINVARVRGAVTLLVVVALAGIGFGLRAEDPARADPPGAAERREQLAAAATAADEALAQLSDGLAAALDDARRGAALTVEGDQSPATELVAAADRLEADAAIADAARRALALLAGTAASVPPTSSVPELSYSGPELLGIAAQLRSAADAATVFVERRHATDAVIDAFGAAVAALAGAEPAVAVEHLDTAAAPFASLQDWVDRPPLLRYWMTIIGRLLEAAREIADASIEGDAAAVEVARLRYEEAATVARNADNALALALSEEGSAVSATPLRRLAAAVREAADLRAALEPLLLHPPS